HAPGRVAALLGVSVSGQRFVAPPPPRGHVFVASWCSAAARSSHTVATCASSGGVRKLGCAKRLIGSRAPSDPFLARDKDRGTLPVGACPENDMWGRNAAALTPPLEGRNRNPLERRAAAGVQ